MLGEATENGLRLNPETKCEVRQIALRSAEAALAAPKDLWIRAGFIGLDCMPRVELENSLYPPDRLKRIFWLDGVRKPGDHAFGCTVTVHHTVAARASAHDARYSRHRLVRCSNGSRSKSIQVEVEPDLEIAWHD